MKDYIIQTFKKAGFDIDNSIAEKFLLYYDLLISYNEKCNLTAITDFEDVILKHFIDSCYGIKYIKGSNSLCDIGTGAGFPAIPLKILCPELKITLIDSLNKRIIFLNEIVKELKLDNCKCIHERAEDAAKKTYREKFDIVTARAVASLNTLCEYCIPFVKVGGKFIAYKGLADEEINKSKTAIKVLGGKLENYEKYNLLNTDYKRSLIVIKKIKPTDIKYPRGRGKEKSKPL